MTPSDIAHDREVIGGATEGLEYDSLGGAVWRGGEWVADFGREEDAKAFIAARTRWPAALDEVGRLRAILQLHGIDPDASMSLNAEDKAWLCGGLPWSE